MIAEIAKKWQLKPPRRMQETFLDNLAFELLASSFYSKLVEVSAFLNLKHQRGRSFVPLAQCAVAD
jgi:hypothetical protein